MPIFEYVCKKCHHRFERVVQGRQRPKCPECASARLERQVEAFTHGQPGETPRAINSDSVIAHACALLGNIPTISRYQTQKPRQLG
jgi:putative FmdB family regulatory protein